MSLHCRPHRPPLPQPLTHSKYTENVVLIALDIDISEQLISNIVADARKSSNLYMHIRLYLIHLCLWSNCQLIYTDRFSLYKLSCIAWSSLYARPSAICSECTIHALAHSILIEIFLYAFKNFVVMKLVWKKCKTLHVLLFRSNTEITDWFLVCI